MKLILAATVEQYEDWKKAHPEEDCMLVLKCSDLEGWNEKVELYVLAGGLTRPGVYRGVLHWERCGKKVTYA